MDVLILKQDIEDKFRLHELLKDSFKVKIIIKHDFIADILHSRTNVQFVFDPNTVKANQVLFIQMTSMNHNLSEISLRSIDSKFKMMLFRDRFDLASLITRICTEIEAKQTVAVDELKLISLLTWERNGLPENDCKILLDHFKSVENLFNLSRDAREFSVKSLRITERSKEVILQIFANEQDYFID